MVVGFLRHCDNTSLEFIVFEAHYQAYGIFLHKEDIGVIWDHRGSWFHLGPWYVPLQWASSVAGDMHEEGES